MRLQSRETSGHNAKVVERGESDALDEAFITLMNGKRKYRAFG